jgi:DnaJ-class molecular chaperone
MDAKIKKLCSRCRGSGTDNNVDPPISCEACGGTGYFNGDMIDVSELAADVDICKRRLRKIMDKLEIKE